MIGKYFLPAFSGIRVQLREPLSEQQLSALPQQVRFSKSGDLLISNALLNENLTGSNVVMKIDRITPWITP
jgi:hypothetical protein